MSNLKVSNKSEKVQLFTYMKKDIPKKTER